MTFHTVAFEGSIGFVNLLQATRLRRKGFETSVLYGPGVTLGVQRGFPTIGDERLRPPELQQADHRVHLRGRSLRLPRRAAGAVRPRRAALIEGIRPINPLDVLDLVLLHRRDNAFILDTWTL